MNNCTPASDLPETRKDSHALQNLKKHKSALTHSSCYNLFFLLPKEIFIKGYPKSPKTFGERLRKARMDAGLLIKDLAGMLGVTEDTIINWELRGMRPNKINLLKVHAFLKAALKGI